MLDPPDGLMMYWMSGWTVSPEATAMARPFESHLVRLARQVLVTPLVPPSP